MQRAKHVTGTVEVLLSTFNGEKYLAEQLDSIWGQDYRDVALAIRDDGSTDGTVTLLERLIAGHAVSRLAVGEHLGAAQSFMALLANVSRDARYAAFCDQDDVWMKDKLAVAVCALEEMDEAVRRAAVKRYLRSTR